MNLESIVNKINEKLDIVETPANILPPFLLKCVSVTRPGLSPYKIASKIIENNKILGIPTGPNPDGSENKINQYTYNVVKCICDAIQNDASVQVSIPMNSIMIQATGGNAGGPVLSTGYNILDSISRGIIR